MNGTGASPIRVLVIEDPEVRDGLLLRCALEADLDVVGSAAHSADGIRLARDLQPDVVVLGGRGTAADGLAAVRSLTSAVPRAGVVLLSLHDDARSRAAAADAGVVFVSKHDAHESLFEALRRAASRSGRRAGSVVNDRAQGRS